MKVIIIMLLLIFNNVFTMNVVSASEAENAISYSVQAVLPDNQAKDVSYFDIAVSPGQEQELEVIINNTSDEEIRVNVSANTAVSNINGLIIYDGSREAVTESNQPEFSEVVNVVEEQVSVPANGEATAVISVKAPADAFSGQILGGLYFSLAVDEADNIEGVGVQNTFSYAIALNITSSENTETVDQKVSIQQLETEAHVRGVRIIPTFNNESPVLFGLEINAEVFNHNDLENPIAEYQNENYSVAPLYNFSLPIELVKEEAQAGDYTLKITLQNSQNTWNFEETFTITDSE